jgi:Flp pilus assembly protein TadD
MRSPDSFLISMKASRCASILAAALMTSACATAVKGPAAISTPDGFTITEAVHVNGKVRDLFDRSMRLLEQEEYGAAIPLLVEVTQAAPESTTAHIDLGMAYRKVDDLERAEVSIQRAVELNPAHPVAHNEMGIVYRRTGRFKKARASYESALALHPDFHFARRNLAILCDVYLADANCALEHYQRYSEVVADDAAVTMWINDLRDRIGE